MYYGLKKKKTCAALLSNQKKNQNHTRTDAFSRASHQLQVLISSFDWLILFSVPSVIG